MRFRYLNIVSVALLLAATACDSDNEGGATCAAGLTKCGDKCVDTDSDRANCGSCGDTCEAGMICNGQGQCATNCAKGTLVCDSRCVDPDTDRQYCGAKGDCQGDNAGKICKEGEVCNGSGVC